MADRYDDVKRKTTNRMADDTCILGGQALGPQGIYAPAHADQGCHLEQARGSGATESASKDPEDVRSAMQIRGVSTHAGCATLSCVRDGFHYKFWVYILTSRTGTLYIGITGYFDKRIHQHKFDTIEGFTKKYQCHRLVYYESFQNAIIAISREKTNQTLATGKENRINRKFESPLAALDRKRGPLN